MLRSDASTVAEAAAYLEQALGSVPGTLVVLGSGLGHLANEVEDPVEVSFERVPGFPPCGVTGHAGKYVSGRLRGVPVLLQAGRYHAYEGHAAEVIVAPVRVAARMGVTTLVLTNAAGGIHPTLGPGDLVLLDDHLNLMFRSPLCGAVQDGEERFPDMSLPYDRALQELALSVALRERVELFRGTYAAVLGPAYETAAEVRMLARLGADVVGMSTVPEVITARGLGLRCMAFAVVTNRATGLSAEPTTHDDVMEVGRTAGVRLGRLLLSLLSELAAEAQSTEAK